MSASNRQAVYEPAPQAEGRSGWTTFFGCILVAILVVVCSLLSVVLTALLLLGQSLTEGFGDRRVTIENVTTIEESYEWSVGQQTVDLRQIELPAGDTEVEATVGAGELVVIVPEGVPVEVSWDVGIGNASVFGEDNLGLGLDDVHRDPEFDQAEQRLSIDVSVGVGSLVVRYD